MARLSLEFVTRRLSYIAIESFTFSLVNRIEKKLKLLLTVFNEKNSKIIIAE